MTEYQRQKPLTALALTVQYRIITAEEPSYLPPSINQLAAGHKKQLKLGRYLVSNESNSCQKSAECIGM